MGISGIPIPNRPRAPPSIALTDLFINVFLFADLSIFLDSFLWDIYL